MDLVEAEPGSTLRSAVSGIDAGHSKSQIAKGTSAQVIQDLYAPFVLGALLWKVNEPCNVYQKNQLEHIEKVRSFLHRETAKLLVGRVPHISRFWRCGKARISVAGSSHFESFR